ncbi:MAG: DUF2203 domain-containing protein [Acidobacteriota bacterium]
MRYFTLQEAERLLPAVEEHLRDALFHKAEYQSAHEALEASLLHIRASGGARVDQTKLSQLQGKQTESVVALQEAMEKIAQSGAMVKDLDIGLLDFMSRYRDQDVCLCWKFGESSIHFWHGEEEGFRGRKPIDDQFLREHHNQAPGSGLEDMGSGSGLPN